MNAHWLLLDYGYGGLGVVSSLRDLTRFRPERYRSSYERSFPSLAGVSAARSRGCPEHPIERRYQRMTGYCQSIVRLLTVFWL